MLLSRITGSLAAAASRAAALAPLAVPTTLAAVVALLAASASPAHAQPAPDAPAAAQPESAAAAPESATTARAYLEPGAEAGVSRGSVYGAVELDGGFRLGDTPLWLHGRFAQGGATEIDSNAMSGDFTEARAGLEVRGCRFGGIACLVAGVDFGYRHQMMATASRTDPDNLSISVARLGFDLGGAHLRFRPSVEAAVSQPGWSGLGFSAGIGYLW